MNVIDKLDVEWVRENPDDAIELIHAFRDENRRALDVIKVLEEKIQSLREMNLMKTVIKEINEDYEILSDWT